MWKPVYLCKWREQTDKSEITDDTWFKQHPIHWYKATAKNQLVLRIKEALHLELHPQETLILTETYRVRNVRMLSLSYRG